jgi:hypothetical protein
MPTEMHGILVDLLNCCDEGRRNVGRPTKVDEVEVDFRGGLKIMKKIIHAFWTEFLSFRMCNILQFA